MADATMELIRSLDDPQKFVKKECVAVFKPHEREFPEIQLANGKKIPKRKITVTESDLKVIAENCNRNYAKDGQLVKLAVGHRKYDPSYPEKNQPPIVGYARNYRAEMVERPDGKVLRLTHTEYIHRDKPQSQAVLNGEYPERSPEYDPDGKVITAVALLTRDQALPLGTVSYESGETRVLYSMGSVMNENTDVLNDEEKLEYEKFCKYFKMAQAAAIGPANAGLPKNGPADQNTVNYSSDPVFIQLQQAIAQKDAEIAAVKKDAVVANCRRLLDPIAVVRSFDYQAELETMIGLPEEKRGERAEYILKHFAHTPAGGMIRVAPTAPVVNYERGGGEELPEAFKEPAYYQKALEYIRANPGMEWDAAVAKATGVAA